MPSEEPELVKGFEENQIDFEYAPVEESKSEANDAIWKNALNQTWATRSLEATPKISDWQSKDY